MEQRWKQQLEKRWKKQQKKWSNKKWNNNWNKDEKNGTTNGTTIETNAAKMVKQLKHMEQNNRRNGAGKWNNNGHQQLEQQ